MVKGYSDTSEEKVYDFAIDRTTNANPSRPIVCDLTHSPALILSSAISDSSQYRVSNVTLVEGRSIPMCEIRKFEQNYYGSLTVCLSSPFSSSTPSLWSLVLKWCLKGRKLEDFLSVHKSLAKIATVAIRNIISVFTKPVISSPLWFSISKGHLKRHFIDTPKEH